MTDQEWLALDDPLSFLLLARHYASERKLLLFACGWCRRLWPLLPFDGSHEAVVAAERCADGLLSWDEFTAAVVGSRIGAAFLGRASSRFEGRFTRGYIAARAVLWETIPLEKPHMQTWRDEESFYQPTEVQRRRQCQIAHDVFPNPFRPVIPDPAWLAWKGGMIPQLARAAYDDRQLPWGTLDSTRLAVLADALEEAGSTVDRLPAHLRSEGPHARGCWAVDVILGRV
jgi:hypothetical protein